MEERVPSVCTLLVPLGVRGSLPLNLVDQVDMGEEMLAAAEHINAELLEDLALLGNRNCRAINVNRGGGCGCGRRSGCTPANAASVADRLCRQAASLPGGYGSMLWRLSSGALVCRARTRDPAYVARVRAPLCKSAEER